MRILVIEDEVKVGSFIRRALEEESAAVDLCTDGSQGLEWALSGSYDMIVLDLMLPYVSGYQMIGELRDSLSWHHVLIIVLSGKVLEQDVVRALDLGADDYVTKPFRPQELLARLRRQMNREIPQAAQS